MTKEKMRYESLPDSGKELNRAELEDLKDKIFAEASRLFPNSFFRTIFDRNNPTPLIFDHFKKPTAENYIKGVRRLFSHALDEGDVERRGNRDRINEFEAFLEKLVAENK